MLLEKYNKEDILNALEKAYSVIKPYYIPFKDLPFQFDIYVYHDIAIYIEANITNIKYDERFNPYINDISTCKRTNKIYQEDINIWFRISEHAESISCRSLSRLKYNYFYKLFMRNLSILDILK